MTTTHAYLGIDLGTTNSAAAVFDGTQVTSIRNAQGETLTPSVVRIDARGNVTVGGRARRFLDTDPRNTRAEFKRLMGTSHTLDFAAIGASKRPEELAAEVLRSIRADVKDQLGFAPEVAVVAVPALFELAQTAATSEAARLAGFTRVEMIQEPVASAIAAGWSADEGDESWLVYDLGGGTFDVTLVATKDGLLRVVGHDGDNFLGGRDFDARIVTWALGELQRTAGVTVDPADPSNAVALRKLRHAAEEAKIELARGGEAVLALPELFAWRGSMIDVDLVLGRDVLERLALPLVDRSIAVCQRLLAAHGSPPLGRVVLVGGPTTMPVLRERVAEALKVRFRDGLDPMTLVAHGAALYAATAHLEARPPPAATAPSHGAARGPRAWLQYPAMTPDLSPYVVGKLLDPGAAIEKVVLRRDDGAWSSAAEAVDAEGAFAIPVQLVVRAPSVFRVEGLTAGGAVVALEPSSITIVHGVTIGDPPLSRSVGVALANDEVQVYFERGSPLPMRRTFTLRTVQTVSRGADGFALRVPIVQGEFPFAHLCRLVGALEIAGADVKANLAAGSTIELALELDRGGRLSASARVPALDQVFDRVAHLVAPQVPVGELAAQAALLRARAGDVQRDALRRGLGGRMIVALGDLERLFQELEEDIARARGGDADAAEKARRALLEIDASLGETDAELAWPAMEDTVRGDLAFATSWLAGFGTAAERQAFDETVLALERGRVARDAKEVKRQLMVAKRLGWTAYYRSPGAWEEQLDHVESRVTEASDLRRADSLVREGRAAANRGDVVAVERAVRGLWALLPPDAEKRRLGHSSGVR
jgi:molecular chaperone DnaK